MQRTTNHSTIAPAPYQGELLSTKPPKRLIDYTECRSDGTKTRRNSSLAQSISVVPICQAFDATYATVHLLLATVEEEEEEEESIEFFLKITPRHKRKNSRESTLDIIGGPNKILQQMASLVNDGERFPRPATVSPFKRSHRRLVTSVLFNRRICRAIQFKPLSSRVPNLM
jgi:hypothetical protein